MNSFGKAALAACCLSLSLSTWADEAADVHSRALVLDAHADIEIPGKESMYVGPDGRSRVTVDKMRAGGVDAVVLAIGVHAGDRNAEGYAQARGQAMAELAAVQALTSDPESGVVLATSAEQVRSAAAEGDIAAILGFQNARSLGGEVDAIDAFYDAGVRVFALTHMGHNAFADSSRPIFIAETGKHEPTEEHGGLSELGVAAVARVNQLGAVLDVSQLSKAATLQVVEQSTAPVIASHSNVRALTDVSRNLSDEEIDAIAEGGGVIHLTPFRAYLHDSSDKALDDEIRGARRAAGLPEDYLYPFELYWELHDDQVKQQFLMAISNALGPGTLDQLLAHIDYVVQRVGIDHVGIGTDFNHGGGIEGFQEADGAGNLTAALLAAGYSSEDIEKIWSGNFLRVMDEVAAASE